MLKDLRSTMSDHDYDTFMALKDLRNKHVHEGRQISRQQAQSMLDIVKNHVLKISNYTVKEKFVNKTQNFSQI